MWHLIKSEWLRFRSLALVLAVAHFLILRLAGGGTLFQPSMPKLMAGGLLYPLGGLLLGLYQIGSYKKLDQWTYLIHRPLSPRLIFAAITTAAGLVLALVFALPLLLTTLYLDFGTATLVDHRQYLMPLFVLGVVLAFYWLGCLMVLSPSRSAFLVGVIPFYFLTRQADGPWLFAVQAIVLLWLGFLVCSAFKPDLSTPPKRWWGVGLNALPLQFAFLGILSFAIAFLVHTLVAYERHGWRSLAAQNWSEHFADGTFEWASYARGADAIEHGLAGADSDRARHVAQQIELAAVHDFATLGVLWPHRHQPMVLDRALTLNDAERGLSWTFSHDHMLFHGQEARSGRFVGWFGVGGRLASGVDPSDPSVRFAAVPRLFANRYVLTPRRLYEYDAARERLDLRFRVTGDEVLAAPLQVHDEVAFTMTDRALYFFESRDLRRTSGEVEPTASVPLPGRLENLYGVQVAELLDSYVVSFLFGNLSERGFGEARQVVGELAIDGSSFTTVADRPLTQGWADYYRYRAFVVAPLAHYLDELFWGWIKPGGRGMFPGIQRVPARALLSRSLPTPVLLLTLVLSVLVAALTARGARERGLGSRARWVWTVAVLVTGVAGYLSYLCLTERCPQAHLASARPRAAKRPLPEAA